MSKDKRIKITVGYRLLQVGFQRIECSVRESDPWTDILANVCEDVKSKGYDLINVSSISVVK